MSLKQCDLRQLTQHSRSISHPTYGSFLMPPTLLHNPIKCLRDEEAPKAKEQECSSDTQEPGQVTFSVLSRDPNVHTPEASYNVHRKDDRTKHRQLAEHVSGLLLSLIHANVDLCKVVAVGARENPAAVSL